MEYKAVNHTFGQGFTANLVPDAGAQHLIDDDVYDQWGTFWRGPIDLMPQGFTLEFADKVSLDNLVLRNSRVAIQ